MSVSVAPAPSPAFAVASELEQFNGSSARRVSLSEVLSSLSHALDLTEGLPVGHSVRTCVIGMRIAGELGLSAADRSALYYALLLKDAGCSSNAAHMANVFGTDERVVKPHLKVVDWHRRALLAFRTLQVVGRGRGLVGRVRTARALASSGEDLTRSFIAVRCERGADIARRLGFPAATSDGIRSLDEHWCGLGYPDGLAGDEIPLLARIINISQTIDAFQTARGVDATLSVVKKRRGTWFDPALADLVLKWRDDSAWWARLRGADLSRMVLDLEPADRVMTVDGDALDEIARAFADIIDAKSPFTSQHSARVAELVRAMAGEAGVGAEEQRRLYLAGLLHDIGKLGVSSAILDKPGPLTPRERVEMQRHPMHSLSILSRVSAFGAFAWTAAVHHERIDGEGYPWRIDGAQLDPSMRLLAAADVYEALTAIRPYRAPTPHHDAMRLMNASRGTHFGGEALDALTTAYRVIA